MNHHASVIRDQFTRQANVFAAAPQIKEEKALRWVVQAANAGASDTVLDVACGPGLLVCAFAAVVCRAIGLDLTPAMIGQAQARQTEQGLANMCWQLGDVSFLPFVNAAFSIVTARYAFHHLLDPQTALAEMKRVCRPAGKVVVIDVAASPIPDQAAAFNRMEKLRDPSHVRALTLAEWRDLFRRVELTLSRETFYKLEFALEPLLQGSFPRDGDADSVRQMFIESAADNSLGLDTHFENGVMKCAYPIAVLVAENSRA